MKQSEKKGKVSMKKLRMMFAALVMVGLVAACVQEEGLTPASEVGAEVKADAVSQPDIEVLRHNYYSSLRATENGQDIEVLRHKYYTYLQSAGANAVSRPDIEVLRHQYYTDLQASEAAAASERDIEVIRHHYYNDLKSREAEKAGE
jgi:predicted DNA-binding protein (UPF0251 family)